jgi:hypothetical protein
MVLPTDVSFGNRIPGVYSEYLYVGSNTEYVYNTMSRPVSTELFVFQLQSAPTDSNTSCGNLNLTQEFYGARSQVFTVLPMKI